MKKKKQIKVKKSTKKVVKNEKGKKKTKPKPTKKRVEKDTTNKKANQPIKSGILCNGCKEDIPQQRIDYFLKQNKNCTKCVNCSDVKTKKPIVLHQGEGDHTYEELIVVDDETYQKHKKIEEATNRIIFGKTKTMFDEEPKKEGGENFIK